MQVPVVTEIAGLQTLSVGPELVGEPRQRETWVAQDVGADASLRRCAVEKRLDRVRREIRRCQSASAAAPTISHHAHALSAMSCGAPTRAKSSYRESGSSIAGCRESTASSTSFNTVDRVRAGSERPRRNANSASATRMWLPSSATAPGAGRSLRDRRHAVVESRPASGPSTPMCACPTRLVAAIFHPTTR